METMDDVVRVFDTTLRDGEQSPGASLTSPRRRGGTPARLAGRRRDRSRFPGSVSGRAGGSGRGRSRGAARPGRGPGPLYARRHRSGGPRLAGCRTTGLTRLHCHFRHPSQTQASYAAGPKSCTSSRNWWRTRGSSAPRWSFRRKTPRVPIRIIWHASATWQCRPVRRPSTCPTRSATRVPEEYAAMFRYVRDRVDHHGAIVFSAHCHDDLGLATANTLAAVQAGARQIEVTINGLGERAGNAAAGRGGDGAARPWRGHERSSHCHQDGGTAGDQQVGERNDRPCGAGK